MGDNLSKEGLGFVEYPDNIEEISEEDIPNLIIKLKEQFINNQKLFNKFIYSGYGLKFSNEQIEKLSDIAIKEILEERNKKLKK